jgi:prephenate dehydratase
MSRIAFLGPRGTFTEEALLTQPDLRDAELAPMRSFAEVLASTEAGQADYGFVAIENSIEGTVSASLDPLVFDHGLLIQREVVLSVSLNLLAHPAARLEDIRRVVSIPVALAQCRGFLARHLPDAIEVAATSTAEAARLVGEEGDPAVAAVANALAAKLYGLDVLVGDVEDHPENQTRFVLVASSGIPAATGHDKTSIVCFESSDRPGNLLSILQEFAARDINLVKLESRPTKQSLGDYCFIIDLEGHLNDELVADALRSLRSKLPEVKFLGSYPAAGEHGPALRRDAEAAWRQADEWVTTLRRQVRG